MPPRDPNTTQLDNPALVRDLIEQLQILGTIGLLDFVPAVNPVFIVGSRGLAINVERPAYGSANITSAEASLAAASAVVGDTGPLPAGTYDIWANCETAANAAADGHQMALQHRNAANAATLATLAQIPISQVSRAVQDVYLPLTGYILLEDERLRWQHVGGTALAGVVSTVIAQRLRTSP